MKKLFLLLTIIFSFLFMGCNENDPKNNIIVVVKYKAQSNKSVDAVTGLKRLIEEVKEEDHFVSIRLHVDQEDNSNIMLYEEWEDELYYKNQHMATDHFQEFIVESQEFLATQPEITYWKVNEIYE